MIYRLNRNIGEYKKGMTISTDVDNHDHTDLFIEEDFCYTWHALGWLALVEEGRWKPKDYETYYVISENGAIDFTIWRGTLIDETWYGRGIIFKTREEAEEAAKKVKELLISLHK